MPPPRFLSYAQNLEDILLWRGLQHVRGGCYIDVGANDPRGDSVSRGFYEQGWRGVHFEPHPLFAAKLRQDRPDETVHEVALSDTTGTLRFLLMKDVGLSTGASEYAEQYRQAGLVVEERDVVMTTLEQACAHLAGRDVHWMKIDVEGMEDKVLRGWNPRTLRPWVIVVEATRPNSTEPSHQAWEPLLVGAGYRFVLFDGLNRFYVANERPEIATAFTAPVNVHDLLNGCEIHRMSPYASPAVARVTEMYESSATWRWTRPLRQLAQIVARAGARRA
jgi:FkbM family methyltransferase